MKTIQSIIENQKIFFEKGATKDIDFRKKQLNILEKSIKLKETDIMAALKSDLNKSNFEAYETELGMVSEEIKFMLKNIDRLARPKRVKTPVMHFISTSKIYKDPYGIVLIMSPWNYPFQLTIAPLVAAIASGNCSIVKPSNYSPNTSAVIRKIIAENFEENYISVVEGGREVNQSLLEQKFDYIFFTGSVKVGKIVMSAAAKHLTPVALELGGKSPCIVDDTANISLTAKRIAWGKFLNAGQTCVAPDYILVNKNIKLQLMEEIIKNIRLFYGDEPQKNSDYPKIINRHHFDRLIDLLKGEKIVFGGKSNLVTNQIAPTILNDVTWDSPVMNEEIFGPILPILEFDNLNDIVPLINSRPKPLALYFFTESKENKRYIINNISFGGGCINDTIVHLATPYMPFGGIGESGMGSYHGEAGFETFTHNKGVLNKSTLIDVPLRYPPFKEHLKYLRKILR